MRRVAVKSADDELEKLNIEVSDEDLLVDEDPADDESETPETDSDNASMSTEMIRIKLMQDSAVGNC